jgi:Carboxypeptidase regulatory-like domain
MSFERNRELKGALAKLPGPTSRLRRAILCLGIVLPSLLAWGCSGVVSGQNSTAPPPPPQTFSISGTITPVTGGNGATITISGAANATATADSSGNFTVSGLANGTYTITPSHAGYSFSPSSMNVTISNASISTGISFTATALTFGISGTLSPVVGGSGATVTLSGAASATMTSDGAGNYSFSGLANGTYTVTPSHPGYTFNPSSKVATVNGSSVAGINFTATPQVGPSFSISGTISPIAGGSGATVNLSGAAAATTTADSAGNYIFSGLSNGTYAVTPSHAGYTFNPNVQPATINGANVTGVNFSAQSNPTFSISGTISPITGGSGSTVTLSGAAAATTVADSSGNYIFTGLGAGSYTVTPANTGYTFSPPNQSATISNASVGSINFTATPQVAHTVALTWNASTSAVSGYNVYRSIVSGSSYVRINSSLSAGLSFTDATVQNGITYYYVTTAVDASGNESSFSNEVSAPIP